MGDERIHPALIVVSSDQLAATVRPTTPVLPGWRLRVVDYTTAEATVDGLRHEPDELLILECQSTDAPALKLVRDLRDAGDFRPIIIVSLNSSSQLAVEVGRCGADEFVVWSDRIADDLVRAVTTACQRTDLRRERALLEARYQLSQKMEAIGVLAGGLAHDFNNMLASIMGFAELAEMKLKRRQDVGRELDFIIKGCRQMADLVQQLVRFSTRRGPQLTRVRVSEIFDDLVAVLGHSIPKSIKLNTHLPRPAPIVAANPAMVQQILMNLCLNAIDSMPSGGTLSLEASLFEPDEAFLRSHPGILPGSFLRLRVADTGCGIPAEHLSRIFEPFFTTKSLSASKGTGLGLSAVWHNATQHGGAVDVHSKVGEGSTFEVYLPVDVETTLTSTKHDGEPVGGGEFILVVDDESMVCEMARITLESLGYGTVIAETGKQALDTYSRLADRIDAVLLDISLPDLDGKDVCKRLLYIKPDLPIVFATGHDTSAIGRELLALGAKGFLQKPFDPSDLDRALRQALGAPAASA